MRLFIGLMSGTSMDGIDAALFDTDNKTLIRGLTRHYSRKTHDILDKVMSGESADVATVAQLNVLIGREFAEAANELLHVSNKRAAEVIAIGSHGQTIAHDMNADIPYTIQLGCAHTIAELTGITVVADFRTRDVVLGGLGAPFAPVFHHALFSRCTDATAIVNIGGIANISFVHKDKAVTGYDIGPGNCLMDGWSKQWLNQPYDKDGEWASKGVTNQALLGAMLNDSYFKKPAPKSIGKEYFSSNWLSHLATSGLRPEDIQATLLTLTVTLIGNAIDDAFVKPSNLFICGGGVHNTVLMERLVQQLPDIHVSSTQAVGIDPDFMEAMMFAWFAQNTITHTPVDMKAVTGASKAGRLGVIYYP